MARTARQTHHVSLFPFLAVLVCAMGALIFLLLVTTRQIRRGAIERAQAPVVTVEPDVAGLRASLSSSEPSLSELSLSEPTEPRGFAISGRLPDDPDLLHPRPVATVRTEPEVIDRSLEWQQRVAELERELQQLGATLQQRQDEQSAADQRVRLKQDRLETLARELQLAHQTLRQKELASREIVQTGGELEEQIERLRQQIEDARLKPASASTRFAFLPFDGETGTVRRPILIECTSEGFVFVPEGVSLVKSDFNGFVPEFNPLLGGAQALIRYWKAQDRRQKDSYGEPYVLLVVRPGGTVPYYVARRMLAALGADFGYELIEDDAELDLPVADENAQQVCRLAVDQILARRDQLAAQLEQQLGSRTRDAGGLPDWNGGSGTGSRSPSEAGEHNAGRGGRSIRLDPNGTIVVTEPDPVELESQEDDPDQWGEFVSRGRRSREGDESVPERSDPEGSASGRLPRSSGARDGAIAEGATRETEGASGIESRGRLVEGLARPGAPGGGMRGERVGGAPGASDGNRSPLIEHRSGGRRDGGHPIAEPNSQPEPADVRPNEWGPPGESKVATDSSRDRSPNGTKSPSLGPSLGATQHPNRGSSDRDMAQGGHPKSTGLPGGQQAAVSDNRIRQKGGSPSGGEQSPPDHSGQPGSSPAGIIGANGGQPNTSSGSAQSGPSGSVPLAGGPPEVQLGNRREEPQHRRSSNRPRRWGVPSLGGTIGYEREVEVQVHSDRMEVGRYYIRLGHGTSRQDLSAAVADLIDLQARTWGAPPNGFYWVPTINYRVHPGAQQQYERLYGITHGLGLAAKAQMVGPAPGGAADATVRSASGGKD